MTLKLEGRADKIVLFDLVLADKLPNLPLKFPIVFPFNIAILFSFNYYFCFFQPSAVPVFSGDLLIMNTVVIIRVVKHDFTVGMGK